ncbi:putative RDD family membrane protein YckC [Paenibacillus eucommiae]|uniref:RDD family membrane protein YckC n=1 Tax=Paenibacillus eucommiae TaxID=1355755 RepID=A0ABS4IVN2_9BACL|nr:putative RDD family membrane protein YckC [Paenibacillus eucommiae]
MISVFIFPQVQQLFTYSPAWSQFYGFLIVTLPVSAYFVICDSKLAGQSFGKRKAAIRVTDYSGKPLSIAHSVARTAIKFIPWELSHFLAHRFVVLGEQPVPFSYYVIGGLVYGAMFAYILTAIFSKKKQALYDRIVRTRVLIS